MYFKAGNYNQTNASTDGAGTKNQFYALTLSHQ